MGEMKPCRCCGIKQSPVDEKNAEYETLVSLVLQCGDEKQLLTLIDIMRSKITTCVSSSDPNKLPYPDKDLWHVQIMADAVMILQDKLLTSSMRKESGE